MGKNYSHGSRHLQWGTVMTHEGISSYCVVNWWYLAGEIESLVQLLECD